MHVKRFFAKPRLLSLLAIAEILGGVATAGAEGHWERLAPLPEAMEEAVGVAAGGKLYVIEGLGCTGTCGLGVVYSYDDTTNTWSKKKPMPLAAHHAMATEYQDKIYVFGGFVQPGKGVRAWQPVDNSWEYTPETDTWKALAPLPKKRGAGTAVVVDGKLYVIGGATTPPGATDPTISFEGRPDVCVGNNDEYDPATNQWRSRAPMPTARNHFFGAAVNGKIYAIGGRLGSGFINRSSNTDLVEEYDVGHDLWATKAPMPTARSGVAGGVYKGKIYVGGGEYQNDKVMMAFRAFEAYDPATNTWESMPRMPMPRHGFAGAVIGHRLHFVAGGFQSAGDFGNTAYTFYHDAFDFEK